MISWESMKRGGWSELSDEALASKRKLIRTHCWPHDLLLRSLIFLPVVNKFPWGIEAG